MPTTSTPLEACLPWKSTKRGTSSRHGTHQVAQKLKSTGLSSHSLRRCGRPAASGKVADSNSPAAVVDWRMSGARSAPVAAAAIPMPPNSSTSRRAGIAYQGRHFRNARPRRRAAGLGSLERHALVTRIEDGKLHGHAVPGQSQNSYGAPSVSRVPSDLARGESHIPIKQKDLDLLRAFRKELQLDFRIGTCRALQYGAGEIRMKGLELAHGLEGDLPQLRQHLRMLICLVERAVGA